MSKIGSNTKGKKKDDVKPFTTHERTFSNQEKKRPLNYVELINKGREEGTGGKKLISSNPRENIFKYKWIIHKIDNYHIMRSNEEA